MARLPGRFTYGPCHCRDCGGGHNDTRRHKRIEQREVQAETYAGWRERMDSAALEADLAARRGERRLQRREVALGPMDPGDIVEALLGECRHGCNGSEVELGYESERCDFTCHRDVKFDPARAARFDAIMDRLP